MGSVVAGSAGCSMHRNRGLKSVVGRSGTGSQAPRLLDGWHGWSELAEGRHGDARDRLFRDLGHFVFLVGYLFSPSCQLSITVKESRGALLERYRVRESGYRQQSRPTRSRRAAP